MTTAHVSRNTFLNRRRVWEAISSPGGTRKGVRAIAEELGLKPSMVHAHLRWLIDAGYIDQPAPRMWRVLVPFIAIPAESVAHDEA